MRVKIVFLCLFVIVLCSCSAKMTEDNLSQIRLVKQKESLGGKTQEERAAAIKNRLHQVDGIEGTSVVVEGHTAIIGLRLKGGADRTRSRIIREADVAVKDADLYTTNTSITTNSRIVSLIEEAERRRSA